MMGAADDFIYSLGKMMMHELSEAYEGSLLSKEKGVSSPRSGVPGNVYEEAHKRATPQTVIEQRWYNKHGRETNIESDSFKKNFLVRNHLGKEAIILIYNKYGKDHD